MNISYEGAIPLNEQTKKLLADNYDEKTAQSIGRDIENGFLSVFDVYAEIEYVGIIVCRKEVLHDGQVCLVICHAVAVAGIRTPLHDVLGSSLVDFAKEYKFDVIRFHAERPGVAKMLEKYDYKITEVIFTKSVCQQANQPLLQVPNHQPLVTTNE